MNIPYKKITVMVIPTNYCNMNCVYCFNGRKTNRKKCVMSFDTLRKVYQSIFPYYEKVTFIWHGGEPLSMGPDFYEKAFSMQNELNYKNIYIHNSIQTNLTLVDEEIAKVLKKYGVSVGGSYDGLKNNLTRHNTSRILKGLKILKENKIPVGIICVVQKNNIDFLIEDYNWFKKNNLNYSLNLYLSAEKEEDCLKISPEHYSERICELFDYWMEDQDCSIKVRLFEVLVDYFFENKKTLCSYSSCLGRYISVRPNGDIYPCNRDFSEEFCFGNIMEYHDIHECFNSNGFQNIINKAYSRREKCKEKCDIYDFCSGGCNNCALVGGDMALNYEYYCQSLRFIYHYIENKLQNTKMYDNSELNPRIREKIKFVQK